MGLLPLPFCYTLNDLENLYSLMDLSNNQIEVRLVGRFVLIKFYCLEALLKAVTLSSMILDARLSSRPRLMSPLMQFILHISELIFNMLKAAGMMSQA